MGKQNTMMIEDLDVIRFRVPRRAFHNGVLQAETTTVQTLTRVRTDTGAEGYYLGGRGHGDLDGLSAEQSAAVSGRLRNLVVGQDAFDRERFWHWLWVANVEENLISVLDMVLWDLQARAFGIPVYKLMGGCRDRIKAYASTYPNMGSPQDYADHAAWCREQGYRHYKIHPYYFWDPVSGRPDPGRPSHIEADLQVCRAVRDRVGSDMVLSFDPWGTYRTYEEAVKVGRVLEELDFYWYEHPMSEYRVGAYEKLCAELDIPVLAPEIAAGFHRACAAAIAETAERCALDAVAVSGGCFQNKMLLEQTVEALQNAGRRAYWPRQAPANDGGLALGQIAAARADATRGRRGSCA